MQIIAVIGSESHTTSRGWASVTVNGQKLSHRGAVSKKFLTGFGDKHAMWVECVFEVPEGAAVMWEAGTNSGSRGAERVREKRLYRVDPAAEILETPAMGYPARDARLRGRLMPMGDAVQDAFESHEALKENL